MSDDTITLEAQHQATIELLKEEISRRDARVLELETELRMFREEYKTIPPGADTGDLTKEQNCANMLQRIDNLESRESDRAGAIQELTAKVGKLEGKLDTMLQMLEKLTAIDPEEFRKLSQVVHSLPCVPQCPEEPKPRLSLVDELAK